MPVESVMEYERIWVEGLNRGDVSAADAAFAPECVVHMQRASSHQSTHK